MFLGHTFALSGETLMSHAPAAVSYKSLTIQYAVFDEVFATVDIIKNFDGTIPDRWTFDTRLHALFHNSLYGGNVNFTESVVESVRIKRRTGKDKKFKTVLEKEIRRNEDFAIEWNDFLAPIGEIEYAYVPVISGGENDYIVSKVTSDFDHYFLCEKDRSFPMILNASYSQSVNYETAQVKPLGRKYPVTVINGATGYKSGTMECLFVPYEDDVFDSADSFSYRELVYAVLTNHQPKVLKDSEGNLLLVHVTGEISEADRQYLYSETGGFYYLKSKFNWVECGDGYDMGDLYDNNLIDTDLDR